MAKTKTKKYTHNHSDKPFTIDDARNFVLKIKKLEGCKESTLKNYEKVFNDFDRFFGEKANVKALTVDDARNFVYWQLNEKIQYLNQPTQKKKKGVSVNTANMYLNIAKGIFRVLKDENIIEENIFQNIKRIKDSEKKIETLTPQEISKLLRSLNLKLYAEFRTYVMIHVLLDTFGRIGEILLLKKSDIDLEHQCVTFKNTKNRKTRIVPISKKTVRLLEELYDEIEEFDSEYVFLTNTGTPLDDNTFRKNLYKYAKRAGIEKKVHPHLFRHTASEMFLRQNGSIRVLQKILGHSDLVVTSRYAHVLDSTIREQHQQFSPLNLIEEKEKRKVKRKGVISK
ncbi:tyrosine-type recombinase/integrase [Thermolongibacillus altinsuensis]